MIRVEIQGFQWGTNSIDGHPDVRQLNIKDPDSETVYTMVFGGVPIVDLVLEMSLALTDEQKAHVAQRITAYSEADIKRASSEPPPPEIVDG